MLNKRGFLEHITAEYGSTRLSSPLFLRGVGARHWSVFFFVLVLLFSWIGENNEFPANLSLLWCVLVVVVLGKLETFLDGGFTPTSDTAIDPGEGRRCSWCVLGAKCLIFDMKDVLSVLVTSHRKRSCEEGYL